MTTPAKPSNFLRQIIERDLQQGRIQKDGGAKHGIRTRFPPEPNGYLHIGHAKSICLNFGLALDYGGVCHLRLDDTNPEKEEQDYVDAIVEAVHWLGFDWGAHYYHAADQFPRLYECAVALVKGGFAYVDEQSAEQISASRGTLTQPGQPSPWQGCRWRGSAAGTH
jgi:glutaminyl-tRNA synthetase